MMHAKFYLDTPIWLAMLIEKKKKVGRVPHLTEIMQKKQEAEAVPVQFSLKVMNSLISPPPCSSLILRILGCHSAMDLYIIVSKLGPFSLFTILPFGTLSHFSPANVP